MNKTYIVERTLHSVVAKVNGHPLNPRCDLVKHSPDGFEFGYLGSGPAQLALVILADSLGDKDAMFYYQRFQSNLTSRIPMHLSWWGLPEKAIPLYLEG